MPSDTAIRKALVAGAAAAGTAALFLVYHFDPTKVGFFPQCPFKMLTGLDCPGCGATRATHAILHGEFAKAFHLNPALLLYGPVLFFGCIELTRAFLTGREPKALTSRPWLGWAITFSIIGWGIVRNTPLWPH